MGKSKELTILDDIDNDCAPTAIWYVSGKTEEEVLRVCIENGFTDELGMTDPQWKRAARSLTIEFNRVAMKPVKLSDFIADHPTGLYLVRTYNHILVVDDGEVIDLRNVNAPGLNRKVIASYKVKQPSV